MAMAAEHDNMLLEWGWAVPDGTPQFSIQRLILCAAAGPVAYWHKVADGTIPDVRLVHCPGDKLCPLDLEVRGTALDWMHVTR
eukprot:14500478-Heterocapsa_arctica.AAC.1